MSAATIAGPVYERPLDALPRPIGDRLGAGAPPPFSARFSFSPSSSPSPLPPSPPPPSPLVFPRSRGLPSNYGSWYTRLADPVKYWDRNHNRWKLGRAPWLRWLGGLPGVLSSRVVFPADRDVLCPFTYTGASALDDPLLWHVGAPRGVRKAALGPRVGPGAFENPTVPCTFPFALRSAPGAARGSRALDVHDRPTTLPTPS